MSSFTFLSNVNDQKGIRKRQKTFDIVLGPLTYALLLAPAHAGAGSTKCSTSSLNFS